MKLKGLLLSIIATICIFCAGVSAGDSSTVTLNLDVMEHRFTKYSNAQITLEIDGKKYEEKFVITRDTKNIELNFEVENFEPGTEMTFSVDYGFLGLIHNDVYAHPGEKIVTSVLPSEPEQEQNNTVNMILDPKFYEDVDIFIDYKEQHFTEYTFLCEDQYAYVPIIELANALSAPEAAYFPEYNCVRIAAGETEMVYFLNSKKYTVNGEEFEADCETSFVGSTIFAQLRPFADVFGCEIGFTDEGHKFNLNLSKSNVITEYNNYVFGKAYVLNERQIKSDTNYLIWVSKSEFTVRVFTKTADNWDFLTSFPCAIGAPGTPTCEGTFKYYQYQDRWAYANYYCGPIMRFNGGYALHSTLIKYNGVPYDNRVGVRISHGCIRLRPENINWLASNIPLYTTVYITP